MTSTYRGACFCGAVQLEVSGKPEAMGYCHCRSCRSWSGGPVNAFTLWKPEAVRVTPAPNMSRPSRRRDSASGNIAGNAAAI